MNEKSSLIFLGAKRLAIIIQSNHCGLCFKMSANEPEEDPSSPGGTWGEADIIEVTPRINSFVYSKIGADHGEDVVQETLLAVCKGLSRTKAKTKRQFLGWVLGIASNKINDALRRKYVHSLVEPLEEGSFLTLLEASQSGLPPGVFEDAKWLLNLIGQSRYPCNTLLIDHFLHSLEHDEIAEIYGLSSPDAARMKIVRCLEAVRKMLKRKENL